MKIDASKLMLLKGSDAAREAKVGPGEPPVKPDLDPDKLLVLKGEETARSAKVGTPEVPTKPAQ